MSTATAPRVKHVNAAEFARADKTANDELKTAVATIRADISKLTSHNVKKRWEIGKQILTIASDTTGRYGTDPKKEIEALMPLSRDGIRPMVKLAEAYDEADVDAMLAFKHPSTGEGISWSHVVSLTRMSSKTAAIAMAEKAVTKGWSTKELVAELMRDNGGPKSKGGRKPKLADTVSGCVSDIGAQSKAWCNSADRWLGEGGIADLCAAEKSTQSVEDMLQKALEAVNNLMIKAHAMSAELNTQRIRVTSAMRTSKVL